MSSNLSDRIVYDVITRDHLSILIRGIGESSFTLRHTYYSVAVYRAQCLMKQSASLYKW